MATCRNCKTKGLNWVKINDKWVLYDMDGMVHVCKTANMRRRIVYGKPQGKESSSACRHGILKSRLCPLCDEEKRRGFD